MTIEQFGKAIVASGLMTADDVKAFWAAIPADGRPKNGDGFGKLLVDKSLLTPFQVAELLAGRGSRLMMGDYTIVSQIGAGGMGQVYKAQHRRMKRTVALKVMSNAAMQDEAAVKRFQREVHAAAKLEHPNIVTAYDSGEAGSVKYLVMQFVDGGDLSDLVKKQGRLGIEQAVGYVIQAAKGLAFAHGEGVIHRDIKPANLLLDKKGVVKILDMGLARFEDGGDGLTATEQVMGTVDYMSPEQAANTKGCDGRADIYSLGCTLWFLLTAKKVYEADTLIARLMKHRDGELPSLVKERDDAPWPLEQALHKMIAKRVQDRYQSMDEVVAALAPFSGDAASSGSIGGASSGGGPSADLASFMQSMGGGGTKTNISATQQVAGTKPATSANIDATAQFSAPDAGTDPKSQVLPKTSARPKPALAKKPGKPGNNRTKLIAAGALGGVLLLAGIIVKIRDKDGNVVAEVNAPAGASVEVVTQPQAVVKPNAQSIPVTLAALPIAQMLDSPDYGWGAPENLGPNVNSISDDWKPTLTADELRMVFRGDGGASQNSSSLWECRRASIDEPFGPRARLTGSAYEDEPFLSGDGLTLLFDTHAVASGRTAKDIRVRRRLTLDAPWAKPESLPLSEDRDEQSPWLSPDELTLIYSTSGGLNGSRDLWICNRATPNARFGPSTNFHCGANSPASESCPQLLSDGRTILFSRDGKPHVTFTSQAGVLSALQLLGITEDVRDAWLSNDGRRLYFNSKRAGGLGGYDIWMMRLMPKNGATPSVPAFVASVSPSFVNPTTPATPPPHGDYALRFVQYNRAEAPNPQLDESQPFTVEAYITPGDADPNRMIGQRLFGVDAEFHFEIKDNRWRFYSTHNEAPSPERFTPRRRVHVAGVRTTTGRQLFLDGKLIASTNEPLKLKSKQSESPLVFEARGGVEFTFDEIRISQGIVYDKEFVPPSKLTADANTLALYHFDEGFGDVVKDSSGKGRDAEITGAVWVKADGSPIPASPPTPKAPATTIPAEALTFAGHRYVLVESFCTWSDAKAKAEAMGGHLATVNSKEERDWILTNVFRKRPRAGEANDRGIQMRLGGVIAGAESKWTWITGEPFDESLWLGSVPAVVEKCGVSWLADDKWLAMPTDSPNARAYYFLVEWDTPATAAAQAGPPAADQALQFDGKTAHVTTPLFHNASTPLTIEVTLRPGPVLGAIISNSEGSGLGLDIVNGAPNFLAFRRSSGTESYVRATAPEALDMSRPHRLAAVYDGAKIRLFVDGKLAATSDLAGEYLPSDLPFIIGASPEGQGIDYPFTGALDEVRISKTARYTADYDPVDRLPSDPDTLAMYHFDDGSGDVLKDSSGHSRHGKVVDAKWVRVEGASGPSAASAALPPGVGAPLDLLPLVDLGQDILLGEWSKEGAGFVTKELKTNSWLRLPVEPGEAYTLRAAFSTDRGNISFVLPFESKGLEILLSTKRVVALLKPKDPTNPTADVPKPLNTGQRHEVLIEVTRPSPTEVRVTVAIDGAPALQWQGTRAALQGIDNPRIPASTLSVGSFLPGNGPTRLLEAQLTTSQGAAKPLRGTSTTAVAPAVDDPAAVAKWLLDNKKLGRIRVLIDGRDQLVSTVPSGPFKVVELNFSKSNNAGQPLTEEEVARLAVFTDTESLELSTLTDAGLAKLAPLKKLKTLIVNGSALTPAAVATIRQFPELEHLRSFGGDEWLKALAGMPTLRSMEFWRDKVSSQAMSLFPQYPNLKELTFFECVEVENATSFVAIAPLKDCKNLSKLTLHGGAVDGAELAVLSGFTQLLELNLNTPSITEPEVKRLAAALPRCKIIWTDAANKKHVFEATAPPDKPH